MSSQLETLKGWDEKILYDLAEYHNGAAFKPKDWVEDGLPIVRIEQINKPNSETDKFNGFVLPRNLIDTGDLIFSWSATLKVVIWSGGPAVLNQHLYKVVPNNGVNKHLLRQILDFNMEKLAGQSQGSTMKHVTRKELTKFKVRFPLDEREQEKIATILKTIDESIEQTEALIEKYSLVKAGMMHDLFTRGLTPDGKLRPLREEAPELYKETPIGWLPKEWEPTRLDELSDIVRGSTPRPAKDPRYFDGRDVPWITVGELSKEDWPYLNDTRTMLTELGSKFSRHLKSGTLIISNSGYGCGVPKILNIDGCANDGVAAFLNFSKDCDQRFIYYFLYSQIETLRTKVARGNDQPNLNTDMLGAFFAPVPDYAEQVMIAERLWVAESLIKKEKINRDKLRTQKSGLMHDLLTGEVTVKVDDVEAANV